MFIFQNRHQQLVLEGNALMSYFKYMAYSFVNDPLANVQYGIHLHIFRGWKQKFKSSFTISKNHFKMVPVVVLRVCTPCLCVVRLDSDRSDSPEREGIELCGCHSSVGGKIVFLSSWSFNILVCLSAWFWRCQFAEILRTPRKKPQ